MNVRPSLVLEDDASIDYGSSASVGLQVPPSGEVRIPLVRRGTASTVVPGGAGRGGTIGSHGAGAVRTADVAAHASRLDAGYAPPAADGTGASATGAAPGRNAGAAHAAGAERGGQGEDFDAGWGSAVPLEAADTYEAVAEASRINAAQAAARLAESAGATVAVPR